MTSLIESKRNRILLKPRFRIQYHEQVDTVLRKFHEAFTRSGAMRGKIVGKLIVIDVAENNEHFWSPQLQLQLEEGENNSTIIRGHYGPKPTLWTLFIFIHFGIALAFAIFATMLYTDWSLQQDYTGSLLLTISMPILWVLFYFFGRWGKMKGNGQMQELDVFMKAILEQ